jgi:hypothetical protein
MSYQIRAKVDVVWIGDGVGQMEVPSAQVLTATNFQGSNGGFVAIPGGDTLTTTNISAAMTTLAGNLATYFNNNIAQLQGFSTGGG